MPEQKPAKPPTWLKRLGSRIRQVRRARGLTQTDLAQPNLTKSFISLLESGRTYPSVGTLIVLANRLQTSLALLLLEDEELPREVTLTLVHLARATASRAPDGVDELLATAETLSSASDDLWVETMLTRGDLAADGARAAEAGKIYAEALAWVRKRRLRSYEPRLITRLATLAQQRGDMDAARTHLEDALTQFRTTRTLRSIDGCDAMLAYAAILTDRGRPARALRVLQDVARVAERQDLPAIRGRAHIGMARVHLAAGRLADASESIRQAKVALEGVTGSPEHARTLRTLADLQVAAGHSQDALGALQQSLRLLERSRDTKLRAAVLADLAGLQAQLGKHDEAGEAAKAAIELLRAHPDPHLRGRLIATMARVARGQKKPKQAMEHFRDAIAIFRKGKFQADLAETARELGMYLKERGEHAEASDYLAMAITAERSTQGTRQRGNTATRSE